MNDSINKEEEATVPFRRISINIHGRNENNATYH
jgi:hypothetical protein